jgi:lysophospholipase L1-like esterase
MSARGRFVSCLATAVVALAGFVTVGALPAAGAAGVVEYVALGDSYAAGWGGGEPYFNGDCKQSAQGYPALLDSQKRIDLVANATCKGAKTSDVVTQLSALKPDTRLVTLTVGGNDLDVAGVAATCTDPRVPKPDCIAAIQGALGGLRDLGPALIKLYANVAAQAPDARIVVTGYPHLFEPAPGSQNADIIEAVNKATDELNATIKEAVTVTHNADVNIRYVDVTEEFAGHGIVTLSPPCTDLSAFIHSLLICDPPRPDRPDLEAFHPTAAGYRAYADAIFDALPGGWLDKTSRIAASS